MFHDLDDAYHDQDDRPQPPKSKVRWIEVVQKEQNTQSDQYKGSCHYVTCPSSLPFRLSVSFSSLASL